VPIADIVPGSYFETFVWVYKEETCSTGILNSFCQSLAMRCHPSDQAENINQYATGVYDMMSYTIEA
jgi:hypothetical protein